MELDTYNLGVISAAALAGGYTATAAVTASNAYSVFLDGMVSLDNNKVPRKGRIAFVSPSFYKSIKIDNSFIDGNDPGMKIKINGQLGEVDGCKIVMVPTSYLPANCAFLVVHPSAGAAPMQLEDVNIHDNPPGISGALIEGRFIYDAFIMLAKRPATYRHMIA